MLLRFASPTCFSVQIFRQFLFMIAHCAQRVNSGPLREENAEMGLKQVQKAMSEEANRQLYTSRCR